MLVTFSRSSSLLTAAALVSGLFVSAACSSGDVPVGEDGTGTRQGSGNTGDDSGTETDGGSGGQDGSATPPHIIADGGSPAPDSGTPCTPDGTDDSCPSGTFCLYPIAEACGATPVCVGLPSGGLCASAVQACACDGTTTGVACYWANANGYASKPVYGLDGFQPESDGGFKEVCTSFIDGGAQPLVGDAGN